MKKRSKENKSKYLYGKRIMSPVRVRKMTRGEEQLYEKKWKGEYLARKGKMRLGGREREKKRGRKDK